MKQLVFIICITVLSASIAQAASLKMVINEWNCVGASKVLNGESNPGMDTYFGTVVGNGDNWVELAVIEDHLDIRGWTIQWDNADPAPNNAGSISFTNNSVWSDLRQGTILVLHENDTDNDQSGGIGELPSNTSYNPFADDWDILASIEDAALITKNGWKVDKNNWEARILDASSNVIQAYVGEPTSPLAVYKTSGGLNDEEVGVLMNGPDIDSTLLSYKDRSTISTFLSPNVGQDFTAMRNEVIPEPSAAAILLSGLLMACAHRRLYRKPSVA